MTAVSQEEVVNHTRTIVQGLEALRHEHTNILAGLDTAIKHSAATTPDASSPTEGRDNVPEKAGILQKSLDQIELGLSEAQVTYFLDIVSLHIWFIILFHLVYERVVFFFTIIFGPCIVNAFYSCIHY